MKNYKKFGLFDFEDCLFDIAEELNNSQLLQVNGGYCGGSYSGISAGGYSCSAGPSGGGSSSGGTSSGGCGGGYSGASTGSGNKSGGGSSSAYGQCGGFASAPSGCSGGVSAGTGGKNETKKDEKQIPQASVKEDSDDANSAVALTESTVAEETGDNGGLDIIQEGVEQIGAAGESDGSLNPSEDNGPKKGHWGGIVNFDNDKEYMQGYLEDGNADTKDSEMNGDFNEYSKVGCKMEGAAKIISEILGEDTSISDVNKGCDVNKDGLLCREEIASYIDSKLDCKKELKTDYFEKKLDKSVLDSITSIDGDSFTYVLGRAENVHGGQHWVVLEGYSVNDAGQVVFDYNATSKNDVGNNRTYVLGPVDPSQKETYTISKIETYTVSDRR